MTKSSLNSRPEPAHTHRRLVRISSVSVASILALLIGSSVIPPLVADQSDRAVVNAPVTLLTAPIAGDIETIQVKAGDTVAAGRQLASISNNRLDRTTAIQLNGKVADLRGRALSAESKRVSNLAYLDTLDKTIEQRSSQMVQILKSQVEELRANISSADASAQEKRVLMDRQTNMAVRNVASPEMVKSTTQAYAAAIYEKEAASAKLVQKVAQLNGLSEGVYGGEELNGLAELTQKRLAVAHDTERLRIEETELKTSLADQQRLLQRENKRIDSLSQTDIMAPTDGLVFNLDAAVGRHVNAGDSFASLVDCEQRFVVAIFSYRQGQNLQVGSRVNITGLGTEPTKGQVTEILPKTSDKVDATYAVPFPQTERRELYVLVKPDLIAASPADSDLGHRRDHGCGVGRWVTVTRESGWVPSTSVAWRVIQQQMAGLLGWGEDSVATVQSEALVSVEVAAVRSANVSTDRPSIVDTDKPTPLDAANDIFRPETAPVAALQKPIVQSAPVVQKAAAVDVTSTTRPAQRYELRAMTVPLPPLRPAAFRNSTAQQAHLDSMRVRAKSENGTIRIDQRSAR